MMGKPLPQETVKCKDCDTQVGTKHIFVGAYGIRKFRYCNDCFEKLAGKQFLEELKAGSQPTKPKKDLVDYNKELKEANKRLYQHLAFAAFFFGAPIVMAFITLFNKK